MPSNVRDRGAKKTSAGTETKLKEYSMKQVAQHDNAEDCWIICDGYVYDVTEFVSQHPGGGEILLDHAGTDATLAMREAEVHSHTMSAFNILDGYKIGVIEGVNLDNLQKHYTNDPVDYNKATLYQVGHLGKEYDAWVHTAIVPPNGTVRLFTTDLMEFFTHTHWWLVPTLWLPVVAMCFHLSTTGFNGLYPSCSIPNAAALFPFGMLIWSLLEYSLHRWVFHTVPSTYWLITIHYLIHGLHHKTPMEKGRLVFPPPLAVIVASPILMLLWSLTDPSTAIGVFAGGLFGYVCYDMIHYYTHHGVPALAYLRELKSYHMRHHYENFNLAFGVSSKLWDYPFHTLLE